MYNLLFLTSRVTVLLTNLGSTEYFALLKVTNASFETFLASGFEEKYE